MRKNSWNRAAVAAGACGAAALVLSLSLASAPALGASGSGASSSAIQIRSARVAGPVKLSTVNKTIVSLSVPAGRWLISGKMWADSTASPTVNIVVGCSVFSGSKLLDTSAFQSPKVGGSGGTAAGVNVVSAVVTVKHATTITFRCDDIGSGAQAHSVVLTALG